MFPDVPFDETLFESNEMMRNYWDRATDTRSKPVFADRDDELVQLSKDMFNNHFGGDNVDHIDHVDHVEGLRELTTVEDLGRNAKVYAKKYDEPLEKIEESQDADAVEADKGVKAVNAVNDVNDVKAVKAVKSNDESSTKILVIGIILAFLLFWYISGTQSRT